VSRAGIAPVDVGVEIGSFFVSSWGYDQTNVDFYKVVGLTPKGVRVQKWTSTIVGEAGGPQEYVVPGQSPRTVRDTSAVTPEMDYWERQEATVDKPAPVETKRLKAWGSGAAFALTSYSAAWLWDGKPTYQTGSGWGH